MDDLGTGRLGRFGEAGALPQPPLFANSIPQTVNVARGADVDADIRTFKGKYGTAYESIRGLAKEIKTLCETRKP
jgi:chromosome partitioning protein